jgi:glycosyltransferase involved in cell wall biosynthesis
LIIAGSDEGYKQQLIEIINEFHIEKKVIFFDFVDENRKKYFFSNSHILLHPVLYMGGVGLIPLEAILCNTPVIVTRECGEIIEKCGGGYIVKYGDIEELTQSIIHIFENYDEAKQKAIEGRDCLLNNFTWDIVVKKYEHLYQTITG